MLLCKEDVNTWIIRIRIFMLIQYSVETGASIGSTANYTVLLGAVSNFVLI